MSSTSSKTFLLLLLIFSQFAGTSLWFAANAVIDVLPGLAPDNVALLTSSVQTGFIAGTLLFALLGIADRYAAPAIFCLSCLAAALATILVVGVGKSLVPVLLLRFITGFFLAGIYPVGMKIAADIFPDKIGRALGWLVGALVLGTSFPHFLRWQTQHVNAIIILGITSALAVSGGLIVLLFFPKDPAKKSGQKIKLLAGFQLFRSGSFRSAALGYFGHMWELYAFWSMLPLIIQYYNTHHAANLNTYQWSFLIIAVGGIGCVAGGLLSQRWGSKRVAYYSLLLSGICCVLAPLFVTQSYPLFIALLCCWGITVTADSPQFSAMVASAVGPGNRGTALTLVTCLGFAITIVSILVVKEFFAWFGMNALWLLAIGPALGLLALRRPAV